MANKGAGKTIRKQLIVLGMHRSGTSAATGLLQASGAYVGNPEELIEPAPENPKGFYEHRDARSICDALLHSVGADWWKVLGFRLDQIPAAVLAEQEQKIRDLIGRLDAGGTWVLKEPRLCLLLPVFRRFLSDPAAVFVLRHPVEVAQSLRRRNGFPRSAALALWEAYVIEALRHSADMPRVYLSYADLVRNPADALRRLRKELELAGIVGLRDTDPAGWIDPALHHEQVGDSAPDAFLSPAQRRLWDHLARGEALDPQFLVLSETARLILEDFEATRAADLTAKRESQAAEMAALADMLKARQAEANELTDKLGSREKALAETRAYMKTQALRISALAKEAGANKRALKKLKRSLSWRVTVPLRAVTSGIRQLGRIVSRQARMRTGGLPTQQLDRVAKETYKSKAQKQIPSTEAGTSAAKKRVAIFAAYSEAGIVPQYVEYYLRHLKKVADKIIFVSDNEMLLGELDKISSIVEQAICHRHGEYDFGSYKRGFEYARDNKLLTSADELILCNDSCFGPIDGFESIFASMRKRQGDFWGITESSQYASHLQSYFLCLSRAVFSHKVFEEFLVGVRAENSVSDVVLNYEAKFTKALRDAGFEAAALISWQPRLPNKNQKWPLNIEHFPCWLLDLGSPLVKTKALRKAQSNLDGINATLHRIGTDNPELYRMIVAEEAVRRYANSENIFFSIVMPTRNRENCIDRAIQSVLAQTHRAFELIIVDDGSTDSTQTLIKDRYREHLDSGRIVYVRLPEPKGVCAARNVGVSKAKYPYIAYVDTDNAIRRYFLQSFAQSIIENDKALTFYAMFCRDQNGSVQGRPFDYEELVETNFIDLGVFVHHKECVADLGGFDEELKRLVDWDLALRYTRKFPPIYIPNILLDYSDREEPDRISRREPQAKARVLIHRKHKLRNTVSTIVPTYNHAQSIRAALDSALAQKGDVTYEIIVSDDGSTDRSPEIIETYCRRHRSRIRSIGGNKNCGISENYRRCFEESVGEFIAVLEGDDYWIDPHKLRKQSQFLRENPDCSMVFSKIQIYNANQNKTVYLERQEKILMSKLTGRDFLNEPTLNLIGNFSCCMFRAELMKQAPDVLFEHRFSEIPVAFYLDNFGPIGYINEAMSVYVQHPGGVWTGATKESKLQSGLQVRKAALEVARDEYKPELQRIIENYAAA